MRGRGAGRAGRDFVTSPEVGALFGTLIARALDRWWHALDEPDPFLVIEAGAGSRPTGRRHPRRDARMRAGSALRPRRTIADAARRATRTAHRRTVRGRARPGGARATTTPRCPSPGWGRSSPRSTSCPRCRSTAWCSPTNCSTTCRSGSWSAPTTDGTRCGSGSTATNSSRPSCPRPTSWRRRPTSSRPTLAVGVRIPVPTGIPAWLRTCSAGLRRGVLVAIDYAASGAELVDRGAAGWLRTYRDHERGAPPLVTPGEQDITIDVPVEYLVHAAVRAGFRLELDTTQADWLAELGIGQLVADAREQWDARRTRRRPGSTASPEPGERGGGARRWGRPRRPPRPRVHPLMTPTTRVA